MSRVTSVAGPCAECTATEPCDTCMKNLLDHRVCPMCRQDDKVTIFADSASLYLGCTCRNGLWPLWD